MGGKGQKLTFVSVHAAVATNGRGGWRKHDCLIARTRDKYMLSVTTGGVLMPFSPTEAFASIWLSPSKHNQIPSQNKNKEVKKVAPH
jgi:hypothetical protein